MKSTRILFMLAMAGVAAGLSACGPVNSINPLFTDNEVVFERSLLGQWSETGPDGTTLRFEQAGPNTYRIIQSQPDNSAQTSYEAHLVALGQYRFLDVMAEPLAGARDSQPFRQAPEAAVGQPTTSTQDAGTPRTDGLDPVLIRVADGFYLELTAGTADDPDRMAHLRRVHWFFRLRTDGENLRLAPLDDEWLQKAIEQGQIGMAHAPFKKGDDLVLTAATGELQQLVLEHAEDETAFKEWTEFRKAMQ